MKSVKKFRLYAYVVMAIAVIFLLQSETALAQLCKVGTASVVTTSDGQYKWTCSGEKGGKTASCSAPMSDKINGTCGSSNGKTFATAPTTGLCATGTAGSFSSDTSGYKWTCIGKNGGTNANCSAQKPNSCQPDEDIVCCGMFNGGITNSTQGYCNTKKMVPPTGCSQNNYGGMTIGGYHAYNNCDGNAALNHIYQAGGMYGGKCPGMTGAVPSLDTGYEPVSCIVLPGSVSEGIQERYNCTSNGPKAPSGCEPYTIYKEDGKHLYRCPRSVAKKVLGGDGPYCPSTNAAIDGCWHRLVQNPLSGATTDQGWTCLAKDGKSMPTGCGPTKTHQCPSGRANGCTPGSNTYPDSSTMQNLWECSEGIARTYDKGTMSN